MAREHKRGLCLGVVESGDTWQHLAFQQLKAGATTGGDVGHLLGEAGLLDSGHGVTTLSLIHI